MMSSSFKGHPSRKKFFNEALFADTLRGRDSTGVFVVHPNKKEVNIFKRAMPAYDFLDSKRYEKFADTYGASPFVVGHNRAATRGGVSNRTAHPFAHDNIVMVHNGTLTNHRTFPECNTFDVDSEALCYTINNLGAKEALERAVGAFAVVWYDISTGKLNLVRNTERPLSYAYCKEEESILFASEPMMLLWIAFRNKIQLETTKILPAGIILSFDSEDLDNPTEEKITLKTQTTTYYNHQNSHYKKPNPPPTKQTNVVPFANGKGDGTLESEKRKRRAKRRLRAHGFRFGELLEFDTVDFEPYTPGMGHVGKLAGIVVQGTSSVLVEAHEFKAISFLDGEIYAGEIDSIRFGDTPMNDVIIVKDARRVIENDAAKEEDKRTTCITKRCMYPPCLDTISCKKHNECGCANVSKTIDIGEKKFNGPKGEKVTRKEFLKLAADGCANCSGNIDIVYHDRCQFLDVAHGGGVLCHSCSEDFEKGILGAIH